DNQAVSRDIVAGTDADDVPDGQELGFDLLFAVFGDAAGFGRGEFDERFDGSASAFGGACFYDLAHQHEKGDDAGLLVAADLEIGGAKGSDHRQGDQFIGGEEAAAQITDGGPHDRIAEDDGPDHRTAGGNGTGVVGKDPGEDKG